LTLAHAHALCEHSIGLDELADQVLVEHVGRLDRVRLLVEGVGGVGAAVLEHNLVATRVVLDEVGQIVDLVHDHHPAGVDCAVLGHLFERVLLELG
jgi:hypothetical protein